MLKQVFDRFELQEPTVTPQGFLKVPGFACRTGILVYKTTDGKTIRVYRPPEEVFKPLTMDSMRNMPLSARHKGGLVNPKNFKEVTVGYTGDSVNKVGDKLAVDVFVCDHQAIMDVQNGMRELSMGLIPEWHDTPGKVTIDGKDEPYDMIHRNLVANHLSLVDQGRAGPEIRLQMDSADEQAAVMDGLFFQIEKPAEDAMVKIKINGQEVEVTEAVAAQLKVAQDTMDAQVATLKKAGEDALKLATESKAALDAQTAKTDTLTQQVAQLKAAQDGLKDPSKFNEAVKARAIVVAVAKHVLPKDQHPTLDAKTDADLKKLAVAAHNPKVSLDGKSDDYVNAAFDMLHQSVAEKLTVLDAMGSILLEKRIGEATQVALDEVETKSMDEMKKKVEDAWKEPKSGCTKDGMVSRMGKDAAGERIR